MSRRTVLKADPYSIYANGDVYIGSVFKFNVADERTFDYIWDRSWTGSKEKKKLSVLLSGYPESFAFIHAEPLARPLDTKADSEKEMQST